ncbi:MAG: hypothetical protein P4N60_13875 [Verrucomicrobiae bacterium]|nr:hypothetical protein [Verrucomicrobiae bacterium]
MTEENLSQLPAYQWMPSRIPLRDALSTFVPGGPEPEPIITEMSSRCGESVWHEVKGGHRVLFLYDGGVFDAGRFTMEPKVWDYNECALCCVKIPAMTLCYVTKPDQPYFLLCDSCYESQITPKLAQ